MEDFDTPEEFLQFEDACWEADKAFQVLRAEDDTVVCVVCGAHSEPVLCGDCADNGAAATRRLF